jgi:hypothetical protein
MRNVEISRKSVKIIAKSVELKMINHINTHMKKIIDTQMNVKKVSIAKKPAFEN